MSAKSSLRRQSSLKIIGVLGRREFPTDGVVDYCNFLRNALGRQGIQFDTVAIPWFKRGWIFSLFALWRESKSWRGKWAVLQYTALSWSRRGFPFFALAVLWVLRQRGVRRAVVFHDAFAFTSTRLVDRSRNRIQNWIMARMYRYSDQPILTAPAATLCWIPRSQRRAAFIPIGANIPEVIESRSFSPTVSPKIISVFSITGGDAQLQEVQDIVQAVSHASQCVGPIRLEVFGRGSKEAHELLDRGLTGADVQLRVHGVIAAREISKIISNSHAVLNVRGLTTSRRGTSIAGIACAVPVVGYGYPGTDPPIDAAGVLLAPWRNPQYLGNLLVQLLSEPELWNELHARCKNAQAEYFSWDAVARRYREALSPTRGRSGKRKVLVVCDHPSSSHVDFLRHKAEDPQVDITVAYRRLSNGRHELHPSGANLEYGHGIRPLLNTGSGHPYPWILIPENGRNGSARAMLRSKTIRHLMNCGAFDAVYVNVGQQYTLLHQHHKRTT